VKDSEPFVVATDAEDEQLSIGSAPQVLAICRSTRFLEVFVSQI
jgi:hypothetical protein